MAGNTIFCFGQILSFFRTEAIFGTENKPLATVLCHLCGLIVRVRVVLRRTVVGDIDRRFDNLSGSHHQSHVNCVSSVYGIISLVS